jgi:hypothetical protein
MSNSEGSLNTVNKFGTDEEKGLPAGAADSRAIVTEADDGVPRTTGFFGKLWKVVTWLDSFGVEARGEWQRYA